MLLTDTTSIVTRDKVQVLRIENAFATAEISLFGAQLLSFVPKHDNRERLWVSQHAIFDGCKPIRGGIPICWPWFGPHQSDSTLSAHGYVRTQDWQILSTEDTATSTNITLQPTTAVGDGFTGTAKLELVVSVGNQLSLQLHTSNLGDTPFTFNCALHSYFNINNINTCELVGLTGQYSDKTRSYKIFDTPAPYRLTEETDRVHIQTPKLLTINNFPIQTKIHSFGHDSIVVWNPWLQKSTAMDDMQNHSYLTMLCVETAITQGIEVMPGNSHILEQVIE